MQYSNFDFLFYIFDVFNISKNEIYICKYLSKVIFIKTHAGNFAASFHSDWQPT